MSTVNITAVNGRMLKAAVIDAANELSVNKSLIDSLNVFPVPDGDTGTNMYLTALAAALEVEKLPDGASVHDVAKAASSGSLRGARGNSGVILSQLYRGFAKGLDGCAEAGVEQLSAAFSQAVETAYRAIMKPKEGTILTVAREMADKALVLSFDTENVRDFIKRVVEHGYTVLKTTTEMLPALKAANVVDAGGRGLLAIFDGALIAMGAERINTVPKIAPLSHEAAMPNTAGDFSALRAVSGEEITFAYCTEFFLNVDGNGEDYERELLMFLDSIGDSVVAASDGSLIKVHVHTNNPGSVLEKALSIGVLDNIKIENMRMQHTEKISWAAPDSPLQSAAQAQTAAPAENFKETAFIAVSSGKGFDDIFRTLGADRLIEGGQSMNPSAEQFLSALESLNAENVIILPNNKNIILAAALAGELCKTKKTFVIQSKSFPQGIAAILNYIPAISVDENILKMEEAMKLVRTGQITAAVRDAQVNGFSINEGDFIGMIDGDIVLAEKNLNTAASGLSAMMLDADGEFVTLYYGEDAGEDDAEALLSYLGENYPDVECDLQNGGQPVYPFIISVE